MANHYIHVGSITNAMRGKRVLEAVGVRAYLHRANQVNEEGGCGYRLLVSEDPKKLVGVLSEKGIRVIRVSDAL